MKTSRVEVPCGAQTIIIESGKLAKQANGAVTVTCGGTVVLATACMSKKPREGVDFFPLTVEYQEKTYSAGKIPGGFFKREGRPTEKEILTSRLIDRPVRPLFSEGFLNEVQIVASVLSHDGENDSDILAIIGASAALTISNIPFDGPVGAVRVGYVDGAYIANPTYAQREQSTLDFTVVGMEDGITMIEGGANEVPEEIIVGALDFGLKQLQGVRKIQLELQKQIGKAKTAVNIKTPNPAFVKKVRSLAEGKLTDIYSKIAEKQARENAINELFDSLIEDMSVYDGCKASEDEEFSEGNVVAEFEKLQYDVVRESVFARQKRADGRGPKDIREISSEVGVLPRTHGSSLFTRGQTQSLGIVTLGTRMDEQLIESLEGKTYKNFMLHYNFPSFSVGETKPMRGPGRREIGHGALACRALIPILPTKEEFPYTVRVVSEILESNGSSSMASVCAGTLSLMDAGVPIKAPVAGISIGLISDEKHQVLITDIMGLEDHFGDMDYKVAGTSKGITAVQLDLKVQKVSVPLLTKATEQAREARMIILDKMKAAIAEPRKTMSPYAPRIATLQIEQEKIGEVIGPGGKTIRKLIEDTKVTSIDIEEDGKVIISSPDEAALAMCLEIIRGMTVAPEIGKIYEGTVKRIMNFGAFVEFLPGREGLVHVSELSKTYVKDVNEVVKVGDKFKVKLIEIDQMKRVNLSKKQAE